MPFAKNVLVSIETSHPWLFLNNIGAGVMQISDYGEDFVFRSALDFLYCPDWTISTRMVVDNVCAYDRPRFDQMLRAMAKADHDGILFLKG
jgi:hypothetical protein